MPLDTNPIDIRVILGSTTPPGRMHRAIDGAIERAAARGTSADLIDLGAIDLGFANGTPPADLDDDTADAIAAIENAKAVIFATPIYRGSMTGSLPETLEMMELVRAGKVDPIPYSKRPMSAASQTLDDLREGKITGRVVLTP